MTLWLRLRSKCHICRTSFRWLLGYTDFTQLQIFSCFSILWAHHSWSNDKPEGVRNYKAKNFMKSGFFQYTLSRGRCDYIRSQADFVFMNPEEIFFIVRVFQLKVVMYPKMKVAFERACEFNKALVCDFGKIDAEIHPILTQNFDCPPFDHVPTITEDFKRWTSVQQTFQSSGSFTRSTN